MIGNRPVSVPELGAEPLKIGYSLALDLGTCKIGAYLYDRASGTLLAETCADNRQSVFGTTVAERIAYASDDTKMLRETAVIREQVFDLILELTSEASEKTGKSASFSEIHYVSIAGNTVMQHLYAATSPKSIGIPPYKPVSYFGEELIAEPTMFFSPCLSGFVGGDLTAALLGSGAYKDEKITLLADLGAEWGLALGNADGFLCASASKDKAGAAIKELFQQQDLVSEKAEQVLIAGSAGMTLGEAEEELAGILPDDLLRKAVFVGNAAGNGACRTLCEAGRKEVKELAAKCRLL